MIIEKGMPSGGTVTLYGEADEFPGLEPGDVIVQLKAKPNKYFKRKGADLVYKKRINLIESLMGLPFVLNHIDKKQYFIESPPGTVIKHGDTKTVEGLGMPFYKTPYMFGNLFVIFEVDFPEAEKMSAKSAKRYSAILS